MNPYAIRVENLGKRYLIGEQQVKYRMLRDSLQHAAKSAWRFVRTGRRRSNDARTLWALKNLSFEVEEGESLGIIGSNGAGKSTLLKILSRVTVPTVGKVRLRGRVGSLLEVGTGFHPELTGRENIFLNGAILGMTRLEIERKFDEIVDFSEMEKFLDTPVKFYSSGMRMRLAFSVAAHLEPEILLVDEVLAVGDQAFQKKSLNKMDNVVKQGRTVLFVSHNMGAVKSLCTRAIYLVNGEVKYSGEVDDVIDTYLKTAENHQTAQLTFRPDRSRDMQFLAVAVLDGEGRPASRIAHDQPFDVQLQVALRQPKFRLGLSVNIEDSDLNVIASTSDYMLDETRLINRQPGIFTYRIHVPSPLLVPGNYRLSFYIQTMRGKSIDSVEHVCPIEVYDNGSVLARVGAKWKGKVNAPIPWECIEMLPPD